MSQLPADSSEFDNPNLEILLTSAEISHRIEEIGKEIRQDYAGRKPVMVCVLKGASIFMSDLIRAIDLELTVDYIAVSSYGKETTSTGEVKILKDVEGQIEGRDIILVEDILDTGLTLDRLLGIFRERKAASIRIVTLLNKPDRRRVEVHADYIGFAIPDKFVVGYGLDYNERYRNLPFIGVLRSPV